MVNKLKKRIEMYNIPFSVNVLSSSDAKSLMSFKTTSEFY